MKVAVLGGCGYLGSVITSEINNRDEVIKHSAVPFDIMLYCDEYQLKVHNWIPSDVFQMSPDILARDFDRVVWCIDIDYDKFYTHPDLSQPYIDKNLACFEKMAEKLKDRLIVVIDDYHGNVQTYIKFLSDKKAIARKHMCITVLCPQLFGPSQRMRYDTLLNSMFYSAFVDGVVYLQDPFIKAPVCSVALMGKRIVDEAIFFNDHLELGYYNCIMSHMEFAVLVQKVFEDKVRLAVSDRINIYGEYDLKDSPYVQIPFGEFEIPKMFGYMLKCIERGSVEEDVLKDEYNNKKIIENAMSSENFLSFIKGV